MCQWTGLALVLAAIGCGSGGGNGNGDGGQVSAACMQMQHDFVDFVSAHASCTSDGDCIWIADGCFSQPLCHAFVNIGGAVEATQKLNAGETSCQCVTCTALQAACNNGTCGPKP